MNETMLLRAAAACGTLLSTGALAQEAPSYVQVHGGAFFIVQDDIELDGFSAVDVLATYKFGF